MFLVVPWERIKTLAAIGLVGGLGVGLVLGYLMQNVFGFWTYHHVDLVSIFGIPFFLVAGWIPVVIAFSHLLAQCKNIILVGVVLLAFPLSATFIHLLLLNNRMLTYHNWNLPLTFLISLGIHLAIAVYLNATGRLENLQGLARTLK
ncbi:hypothetical protein Nther_1715 [Calderihabitans maritimus]|uniref:Uncharacterized protein n=2 Tax=Calderihabitans maritimus TaxID=1246530 RepID=A0A1Z5HQJ0_9FIRM|nr:hypothetical protein Nther_1715 [Calderihabitans maritimus]